MSVIVNPRIVTDGLLMDVDAATLTTSTISRNILSSPEDLSNSSVWTLTQMTVTPNAALAPDGTYTAEMFVATGADPYMEQLINVYAGVTVSLSIYVKAGPNAVGKKGFLWLWYATATGPAGYGAVIHTLTDTWQRVSISSTPYTSGTARFRIDVVDGGYGAAAAAGDIYYMWGAQAEFSSTATDYRSTGSNISSTRLLNLSSSTTYTTSPSLSQVRVLLVGGGGGGGNGNNSIVSGSDAGGGGGAGGLIHNTAFAVTSGTSYTVLVGQGGAGGPTANFSGSTGTNSAFGSLTAIGGGYGTGANGSSASTGGSGGGSGGGGAAVFGGAGTDGQGYRGGNNAETGTASPWSASGGGGAGGPGLDYWVPGNPTPGGPGLANDISGTLTYYAGGGGGGAGANGSQLVGAQGGIGGGGNGGNHSSAVVSLGSAGKDGTPYTGGGGGGAAASGTKGGDGGSGIVIVRYPKPIRASGGTITTVGDDIVHTFTASGTFTTFNSDIQLVNNPIYISTSTSAFLLNGSTQYFPIPTQGLPYGANPSTMEVWLLGNSITTATGYQFALSYGNAVSNQGRHLGMYNDRFVYGSYGYNDVYSGYGITTGTWYHVVGTYDGVTQTIYVNGESLSSASFTAATTEGTAQIGRQVNLGQYWNGQIAKAAIYNKALTANEVKQNFNALRGRFRI